MSLSNSQTASPDWQEQLINAVQQRDVHHAVMLAERCVHRYGMPTLEALLERADRLGSPVGDADARTWLLPLLLKPAMSSEHNLTQQVVGTTEICTPMEADGGAPHHRSEPSAPDSELPAFSAKLDEAFAPLEIAFPPLPMTKAEDPQALVRQDMQSPELEPFPTHSDLSEPFPADLPEADSEIPMPAEEAPDPATFHILTEDRLLAAEAAPVPTFQLDENTPLPKQSLTRKGGSGAHKGSIPPAPISPGMERWLSWLSGENGSRSRP